MKTDSSVTLGKITRALIAGLPDTVQVLKGVGTLLKVQAGLTLSVGSVLETQARKHPDDPALLFEDRRWTYSEFNAWANRLAQVFRKNGVGDGVTVALLLENHAAGLGCVAALAKLGAASGLLNPNLRGDALRHSIRAMKPSWLVIAGECAEAFADLRDEWRIPAPFWLRGYSENGCPEGWLDLARMAETASPQNPASTGKVQLTQPFCYILTSGTTGMPKASVMSHRRWVRGMGGMGQLALRLKPGDVLYCALPLYHNNALTVSWGATLGTGAALALDRKFSASKFWDRIRHYDASAFTYIGELCRYLLAQPESPRDREHRVSACVGNGLQPDLWQRFKQRFGIERICEFYGASEGNLAFVNGFNLDETAGFCPFTYAIVECDPDMALPKRDSKNRLIKVARGGVGLLITEVTKTAPFEGYTDAKAGESKLIRDAFKKGDCWFNTGDLVRDQGWKHIQFVDRLGDTFRWKGENVATTEVEAALRGAPAVADSTVYGVQLPHTDGRAGMAAICLNPGAVLDGLALANHLRARLPAYAVPVFLRLVRELETTTTFKTRKQNLKQEGFDPEKISDPMYALINPSRGYERLTPPIWIELQQGRLKL